MPVVQKPAWTNFNEGPNVARREASCARNHDAERRATLGRWFCKSTERPMLHVSTHPLLLHRVGQLRDRETPTPVFRRLVREIAQLLFWEASHDLSVATYTVRTPLADCPSQRIDQRL